MPPEPLVPPLIANDARDVVGPIHLAAASTTLAPRACWLGGARGADRVPARRFWTPAWLSRRWIRLHALSPWERALLHSQDAGEGK